MRWPSDALRLIDRDERAIVLFRSPFDLRYFAERNPRVVLARLSGANEGAPARPAAG
jgi:hypothetical protein